MKIYENIPKKPGVPAYSIFRISNPKHEIALVIPVINESVRITSQLKEIQANCPEVDVIIADGGSTDGSTEIQSLMSLGVTTLLTKTDAGKLSAQLRMAFDYCLAEKYKAIITMDGNGKDHIDGIQAIKKSLNEGFEFVQGSRFKSGGEAINTPKSRYIAIRFIHAPLTSLGAHHWYSDTTNGFRGFSRNLLQDPKVAVFRDVFDSYEMLAYLPVRIARLGYRISEVPVTREYPLSRGVPTKIRGTLAHLKLAIILFKASLGYYNP